MLIALAQTLAACGSTPKDAPAASAFARMAILNQTGRLAGLTIFPLSPSTRPCTIVSRDTSHQVRVPGMCTTEVRDRRRGSATVILTETWDAKRFDTTGAPGTGTLQHTWKLRIQAHVLGDKVTGEIRETGDVPPQPIR